MTTENNKIIAEFMIKQEPTENFCVGSIGQEVGVFTGIKTEYFKYEDLKFHSDWNWLMEVVEKIESLGYWTELLGGCHQEFRIGKINQIKEFINKDGSDKKEAVYNTCLEFIKYYNEQNTV